jgi:hypothetical protein
MVKAQLALSASLEDVANGVVACSGLLWGWGHGGAGLAVGEETPALGA